MDADQRCLVCGAVPTDEAHWPRTRRYGTATVRLCRKCHEAQHWAKQSVIETLIDKAPSYWKREGTYEANIEQLETWLAKRRLRNFTWLH